MAIDAQTVHLVQPGAKMTVSVAGTRVLICHVDSNTEQLHEYEEPGLAAHGFAATLQDLAKRNWALDPEQSPNPQPLPEDTELKLLPEVEKNWIRLTKLRQKDVEISGVLRLNGRKADSIDPEALGDIAERIDIDERDTVHLVEGGGELLFALAHAKTATIRRLVVDTPYLKKTRQAGLELGDVSYVVSELPGLEFALLVGGFDGVSFESDTLQELHLLSDPLHQSVLEALAKSSLPALHTLTIGLGVEAEADPETEEALLELLASDALPALTNLGVQHASDPDSLLDTLAQSPRMSQLKVLHLCDEFEDDDATTEILNKHTNKLRHARLEVDMIAELFPELEIVEPESRFSPEQYTPLLGEPVVSPE